MTDMTMGQRIAEERRKLALSQEGLGEKVGVSRQAISKWEADGAVPEIDKLIALSKLFGTSVGWLLGVEEAPATADETLSEKQLQMIEQIVKNYQSQATSKKKHPWRTAGILVAIVAILIGGLFAHNAWRTHVTDFNALNSTLTYMVLPKLQAVESAINTQSTAQTTSLSLLAEYKMEIGALISRAENTPVAQINFSAMPNKWQEGDAGFFSVRREGMETVQVECKWDGAFLTADTILDVKNGYEFCFTLLHADGTQEQQVVTDPEIENLKKSLAVTVEILSVGYNTKTNPLKIEDFEYCVTMPSAAHYGDLSWKSIELILATAGGEELGRCLLLDAGRKTDSELLLSSSLHSMHTEIIFENPQLPKNEGIMLWLRAELSNGLSTEELVSTWVVDEDGTQRSQ